jgi:hypothetical protein
VVSCDVFCHVGVCGVHVFVFVFVFVCVSACDMSPLANCSSTRRASWGVM